jgi:hypothetical protein
MNQLESALKAVVAGRGAHAYALVGGSPHTRRQVAKQFAGLLISGSATPTRQVVTRVDSEIHPDLVFVAPEKTSIKLESISHIIAEAYLGAVEGATRVFVVDEAERMTTEAANSLLKVLEEPPKGVAFLLLSPMQLPWATLTSRCQVIRIADDEVRTDQRVDEALKTLRHLRAMTTSERLRLAEEYDGDRETVDGRLQALESVTRDVCLGSRPLVLRPLDAARLRADANPYEWTSFWEAVREGRRNVLTNANCRMVLEGLFSHHFLPGG